MAELADALDSGSSARKGVEVQVLSSALSLGEGLATISRESFVLLSNRFASLGTGCYPFQVVVISAGDRDGYDLRKVVVVYCFDRLNDLRYFYLRGLD